MENSVCSAIEKIKRDEEAKEAKLKAKRELDAIKAANERAWREAIALQTKLELEISELTKRTDELNSQKTILIIRRDVLRAQLDVSRETLVELNKKVELATNAIQSLRSTYCTAVQKVSDECDVWALLTKHMTEPLQTTSVKKPTENKIDVSLDLEAKLNSLMERKEKAIAERDRLKSEPENGEEFVRIKNALRYSLEMLKNLQQDQII